MANHWLDRLRDEKEQLENRLSKLRSFLETPMLDVHPYDIMCLRLQERSMTNYLDILRHRMDRALGTRG